MNLTEKAVTATHRVIVYGGPKTGKTELIGELSEHYNLIWFDCENGWSTLLKLPKEWQKRINIISIPDSRTYPIAAETWLKVIKGGPVEICEAHGKVSCAICKRDSAKTEKINLSTTPEDTIVVFDSLTQLTNSMVSHITKSQPDDYKLTYDDYGHLRILVDKFLSQVQAAGYSIVCTTHEEEVELEDGRKKLVPVSGSSKSSRFTAKYFDHVVYCEVKNKKHAFGSGTMYGTNVVTGSRTNVEIEKSTKPTLLDIFTSWKDRKTERSKEDESTVNSVSVVTGNGTNSITSVVEAAEVTAIVSQHLTSQIASTVQEVGILDKRTPGQIALDNLRNKAIPKT